ncbi:ABC transporter permease [Leucobacter chromiiresistens]|uniref:Peptide/nickel transport system permease protein n=1 Tax=Leucobacter chromiiresistens TaxID=1079994 RepID=A0A1H1A187_9MICO|nr:ABC transporter permease [Leucobacter chromiiresistens]SDQ33380.1 peptide/nickel transport system permease protein [Leucobacter chromiiresistens]
MTDIATHTHSTAGSEPDPGFPGDSPRSSTGSRTSAEHTWARRLARTLFGQPTLTASWLWIVLVVLAAVAPQVFTDFDPLAQDAYSRFLPPSLEHLFGTDDYGRDQFARTVYGTVESLQAAVVAVLIGLLFGSLIGLIGGALRGVVDTVLMRVIDVMLAVPSLIIALAIVTALGRGTLNIAIAIGITSVATFARLMRSEVLRVRGLPYVEAAAFAGHGALYRLFRHIVPNASGSVLAAATLEIGTAILGVAALSFLGFGAPPPTPEWGALVAAGRSFLTGQWWLSTLPGFVIVASVLAVYRIGRSMNQGRTSVVA